MAKISTRPGAASVVARPGQPPPIAQPPPPMVTGIKPSQGEAGDTFDLVGSGLSVTSEVRFKNDANIQFESTITMKMDADVTAIVPQVSPGTYAVAALDADGVPIPQVQTYTVVVGKPPSFDPNDPFDPASGTPGDLVTIHGMHLNPVNMIEFHGTPAKKITHVNSKTLTTKVPKGATTGRIKLIAPTGTAKSAKDFVVT